MICLLAIFEHLREVLTVFLARIRLDAVFEVYLLGVAGVGSLSLQGLLTVGHTLHSLPGHC